MKGVHQLMHSKSWDGGVLLDADNVLSDEKRWGVMQGYVVVVDRMRFWYPMRRSGGSVGDKAALEVKLSAVLVRSSFSSDR